MATVASPSQHRSAKTSEAPSNRVLSDLVLVPTAFELGGLAILTAIGGLALLVGGPIVTPLNFLLPLGLALIVGYGSIVALRASTMCLWTPLVWFRAAVIAYAGFGTMLLFYMNDLERTYVEYFFALYPENILAYNVVTLGFTFFALMAVKLVFAVRSQTGISGFATRAPSHMSLKTIGLIFLFVGLPLNLFFTVPYQFGFGTGNYSALIHELAQLLPISLYLLTLVFMRERSVNRFIIYALAIAFAIIGMLAMSKNDILMPLIMVGLAQLQVRATFRRLAVFILTIVSVFVLTAGPVGQGRYMIVESYGSISAPVPAGERLELLAAYYNQDLQRIDDGINYGLIRFSYVNVGAYVINEYDEGRPGYSYDNAAAIVVPRVIWPDKPIMTNIARDLSLEMTGNWFSSIAPGIPSESYWNHGWMGVALIGAFAGVVLCLWSIYAMGVQVSGAWHLFPVVLLGARMASRLDGFLVTDMLGPVVFAIAGHFILLFGNAMIPRANWTERK